MCSFIKSILFMFLLSVLSVSTADHQLQVNTIYGIIQGRLMTSREGREFSAFLGIPYASIPTGPLRFMPPEPPQPWKSIRNATEVGSPCIQKRIPGKEDCLYLNVFTHGSDNTLPVMVFIHGGGFHSGSIVLDWRGPEYLMDKDIVLVTIQYRLGVFGFLSTEDSVAPGNMGLKDQVRALKWVQDNIQAFGGDPKQVTIFGNSAGSASVHLHMLSSSSKDLFDRAISQSGTAFSAFSKIGKGFPKKITERLAKNLNCSHDSTSELIQCLQKLDPEIIQQEYSNMQESNYEKRKVFYRPIIEETSEHSFLTHIDFLLFTNKPWLVGINNNEGLLKINFKSLNDTLNQINHNFTNFGPAFMLFEDACYKPKECFESIYNFYFKNISTTNELITPLEQMISDAWFVWPMFHAIHQHNGTLFCYLFNHSGQSFNNQLPGGLKTLGVGHSEEVSYLFSQTVFPINMTSENTNISKLLVELWTNFATETNLSQFMVRSNPQNEKSTPIAWMSTSSSDPTFLHIQTRKLSLVNNIFKERVKFWKKLQIQEDIV